MNAAADAGFTAAADLLKQLQGCKPGFDPFHLIGQVFCDPHLDRVPPSEQLHLRICALRSCDNLAGGFREAAIHLVLHRAGKIMLQGGGSLDREQVFSIRRRAT